MIIDKCQTNFETYGSVYFCEYLFTKLLPILFHFDFVITSFFFGFSYVAIKFYIALLPLLLL